MNDQILPLKSLMIGQCRKKNRTIGSEDRFLMLGPTQLLIARDPNFENIVNVIPMEGGFCICRTEERRKDTLTILTQQRFFELRFESEHMAAQWRTAINLTLSKAVKVQKYKKRENEQQRNSAKLHMDEAFILCHRDIMTGIKDIKKNLVDLTNLRKL